MTLPRRSIALGLVPLLLLLPAVPLGAAPGLAPKVSNPDLFTKSATIAQGALDYYGIYDNPEALERVAEIGYRVAQEGNFSDFPFTFHLIDMPAPNAFALPGGHIFITRGMLDLGLSDDMLAGLLGHEIAHVIERHGMRMQKREALIRTLGQVLVLGILAGASRQDRSDKDGIRAPYDPRERYPDQTVDAVQGTLATSLLVSELLLRGYSREFEREADDQGQRMAAAAGYSPGGVGELMDLMGTRLPQNRQYGYWQTHPFFSDRVAASEARAKLLTQLEGEGPEIYRVRTQAALATFLETQKKLEPEVEILIKQDLLTAWPKGPKAEAIRLERLHGLRKAELEKAELSRDYGELLSQYRGEIATLGRLDPKSDLIATLEKEAVELEAQAREIYPKAVEVVRGGVYEKPFLETFLSNYPEVPEVPKVALALGDAHSRLGNQTEAVSSYLQAWEAGPESPEGQRAQMGLRNLAPVLDSLAGLEALAQREDDPELQGLARARLTQQAKGFEKLQNGAEYLRRYPEGSHAQRVEDRLDVLANDLYAEVILYQGVGDNVKAVSRINEILTHAPQSSAAARIRDQAASAEG